MHDYYDDFYSTSPGTKLAALIRLRARIAAGERPPVSNLRAAICDGAGGSEVAYFGTDSGGQASVQPMWSLINGQRLYAVIFTADDPLTTHDDRAHRVAELPVVAVELVAATVSPDRSDDAPDVLAAVFRVATDGKVCPPLLDASDLDPSTLTED